MERTPELESKRRGVEMEKRIIRMINKPTRRLIVIKFNFLQKVRRRYQEHYKIQMLEDNLRKNTVTLSHVLEEVFQ